MERLAQSEATWTVCGFVSIKLFLSCLCFLNFLCCCGYISLAFLSVFHVMLLINCVSLHISLFSTTFFVFFFLFSLSFVAIVSYCPYYSSSHASVKVREGISYWGPLGYEVLKSPKSSQSPDPRAASKRACIFKFRKKKESKNPLIQGENRWDMVIFSMCNTGGNSRKRKKIHSISSLGYESC